MKLSAFVSLLILCSSVNTLNKCSEEYNKKVVKSIIETIEKIIEELEISKTSQFVLVFEDLMQDLQRLTTELSYILDLLSKIEKKYLKTEKIKEALDKYSKSLQELEAWNEVNAENRRKRQVQIIDPSGAIIPISNDLSATNSDFSNTLQQALQTQDPSLALCPSCGMLIPLNSDPTSPSPSAYFSGIYVDNTVLYPGVAYLPSCDGNRPARISGSNAYAPCAFQEQIGVNGSYYCNHTALAWVSTTMANAYRIAGALTVKKGSGDQFLVARFNIMSSDGIPYSTIGYYFIYDFSIEYWDGTQAIRSTNYPNSFDILACSLNSYGGPPIFERIPCRWSQTNITDVDGNYLKTACIIPLAHTQQQAFFYCRSIGWQLYNIESEDERAKLSDFALSVQPGIYNIQGRKALDETWYCGGYAACYTPPSTTQWPNGSCMAFSYDGYQNHNAISSDCDNNKFYSICQ